MNKIKYFFGVLVMAGLLAMPSQAHARKIFLNGVNLNAVDLPAVTLKGCDVTIDAKGNIHITAKGYKIQVASRPGGTTPSTTPRPRSNTKIVGSATDKYYLVSFGAKRSATQYDIEVYINKKMIRRIRARSAQVAMDVTRYIIRGKPNEITFVSRKNYGTRGASAPRRWTTSAWCWALASNPKDRSCSSTPWWRPAGPRPRPNRPTLSSTT